MKPNLEMQISKTKAGLYTVTYGRMGAPLNIQEAAFALHGLDMISSAQHGFLRAQEGKGTFEPYSRTNADVLYDARDSLKVVIVPNGIISKLIGLNNLVAAHAQNQEYVIPESQRDLVYAMVDEMLRKDTAFVANHGNSRVSTSNFGQTEITSKLFSDEGLGIKAQGYGDWLQSEGRTEITLLFDTLAYAKSQRGPYLNRLRVYGPGNDFDVYGISRDLGLNGGAFGVRFAAEGGAKK